MRTQNTQPDKFRFKSGNLTAYAFACGYTQEKQIGDTHVVLWVEHGCAHCRAHSDSRGRVFWESGRLSAMRKVFAQSRAALALTKGAK